MPMLTRAGAMGARFSTQVSRPQRPSTDGAVAARVLLQSPPRCLRCRAADHAARDCPNLPFLRVMTRAEERAARHRLAADAQAKVAAWQAEHEKWAAARTTRQSPAPAELPVEDVDAMCPAPEPPTVPFTAPPPRHSPVPLVRARVTDPGNTTGAHGRRATGGAHRAIGLPLPGTAPDNPPWTRHWKCWPGRQRARAVAPAPDTPPPFTLEFERRFHAMLAGADSPAQGSPPSRPTRPNLKRWVPVRRDVAPEVPGRAADGRSTRRRHAPIPPRGRTMTVY